MIKLIDIVATTSPTIRKGDSFTTSATIGEDAIFDMRGEPLPRGTYRITSQSGSWIVAERRGAKYAIHPCQL